MSADESGPSIMGSADGGRTWRPVQPMGWQEEHNRFVRVVFWLRRKPHCSDEAQRYYARRGRAWAA